MRKNNVLNYGDALKVLQMVRSVNKKFGNHWRKH